GESQALRGTQREEPDKRAQRGQAQVARAHRVATLLFEVVEKVQDQGRVGGAHLEGGGAGARGVLDKGQKESKRVPVTRDGLGTRLFVLAEMVRKEGLHMGCKARVRQRHRVAPPTA